MRIIEKESWSRKEHFHLYSGFEFPHINICLQLDITELWINRARVGVSPTIALVYIITRAMNRVPEMRQRIRGEDVVEHEVVHPLITVLGDNDLFGVVTLNYDPDLESFAVEADELITKAKQGASLGEFPHDQEGDFKRDDLLSITILPWLEFTGFSITRKPVEDTIPLIAFGKVHEDCDRFKLPFYMNFHHALADGVHAAYIVKYIEEEARALAGS